MKFDSRQDAGEQLGRHLRQQSCKADLVAGLPRGGVVVAAEVARYLGLPLDVLIVRKIGHPWHREFAVGAMAEGGVVVLDQDSIRGNFILRGQLNSVIEEEKKRLQAYQARFRSARRPDFKGKSVILVDDGLATGATAEAAVESLRKQNVQRVIVAAPVASLSAVERLEQTADEVEVLWEDPEFEAVGRYYEAFPQTSDEEVLELLKARRGSMP